MCVPCQPLTANAYYKVTVTGSLANTSITTPTMCSVSCSFATGSAIAATSKAPGRSRLPPVFN
ncbi:hypothetical protein AWB83_06820 [Caballeronia ptereochthonis]|uniref:Uncharacterized protein n=1 Tax=Caballeronia ptereochthonis TaxID=1777144 RepID=A0A158E9H9_9BURK|nr:hypothetical protein AWB83_06820 [Caballeronia ptereochthonis]